MSTGVPPASKSRLLAMAPTGQPRAAAASAAVCTDSGRMTISPAPPRAACASRNLVIAACSLEFVRQSFDMGATLASRWAEQRTEA